MCVVFILLLLITKTLYKLLVHCIIMEEATILLLIRHDDAMYLNNITKFIIINFKIVTHTL